MSGITKLIFLKICLSFVLFLIYEHEKYIDVFLGFIFVLMNVSLIEFIAKVINSLWEKCKLENIYSISIAILVGVTFGVIDYLDCQEKYTFLSLLGLFFLSSLCCGTVILFLEHIPYVVRIRASGGNNSRLNRGCK